MPSNSLAKSLHLCFSKLKSASSTRARNDRQRPYSVITAAAAATATTTASTSTLFKNFNSLYDYGAPNSTNAIVVIDDEDDDFSSLGSDVDSPVARTTNFAAIFASQRFFFSSPGRSNSIVDSSPSRSPPESDVEPLMRDVIAVSTDSPDPFMDFRRSMQEMVEAHDSCDAKANRDYLHELLLCYLALNPKSSHKFIVGAFSDLIVSLMSPAGSSSRRQLGFTGD